LGENALKVIQQASREAGAEAAHIGARAGSDLETICSKMFGAGTRCALSLLLALLPKTSNAGWKAATLSRVLFRRLRARALDAAESSYAGMAALLLALDRQLCDDLGTAKWPPAPASGVRFCLSKFECR